MPIKIFSGAFKQLMVSYQELFLGMKLGFITVSGQRKESEQEIAPPLLTETKLGMQLSAGKVMLPLFLDGRGVILERYMSTGNTITSVTYTALFMNHLRPTIKSKRSGLLSKGYLFATSQCLTPYCPCDSCNRRGPLLSVSTTAAILARPRNPSTLIGAGGLYRRVYVVFCFLKIYSPKKHLSFRINHTRTYLNRLMLNTTTAQ